MEDENKSDSDEKIIEEKINLTALKNPWFWVSVGLIIIVIFMFIRATDLGETGQIIDEEEIRQPSQIQEVEVSIDDDAFLGNENAPVIMIEFSDYECPFCTKFYTETLPLIKENYIETEKVKFVYRDFPLSFHRNAQKAAEAAECAEEQRKYFEMHDLLFEKGVSGGVDSFKQYAKEIGLDIGEFNSCLDSGEMAPEVQNDFSDGQRAGVSGTPTFFINGKMLVGAQPFEEFKQIIKQELNR